MAIYYFSAVHSESGDYYTGYTYDDGSYGYYVGYTYSEDAYSYDSAGNLYSSGTWDYYVYALQGAASYIPTGGTAGEVYVTTYYDAESGLSDTPYVYSGEDTSRTAAGTDGLGSEVDQVDFDIGEVQTFGGTGTDGLEADLVRYDTVYYFTATNSDSGDIYYGYVYDNGDYGYYVGYSETHAPDEDGYGSWTYYVYDADELMDDTGIDPGTVYVTQYDDGESGLSDVPEIYGTSGGAAGTGGLGSEYDTVDFDTGTYDAFGEGYYEADVSDDSNDIIYYFIAENSDSGDWYTGWVYDDGTYGYYVGYTETHGPDDDGYGRWTYTITGETDTGTDTGVAAGSTVVDEYYDGETGLTDTPASYDGGTYAGTDGLGSEYDTVDFGTGVYDAFGEGYYEADVSSGADVAYAYYAVNSASGDYYLGWVYDDGTYGYYVGYTEQLYTYDDDGYGTWTYTIYGSYDYGGDSGVDPGTVLATWYYDGETGMWDTSSSYEAGATAGTGGLGSEYDTVDFGTGTYDDFGLGYYEADVSDGSSDVAYAYYAINSASGDYYFGWVYDDGTYGYYVGYTEQLYTYDDDGYGTWTYTIYGSYDYGGDAGVDAGTILTTWYYDGETGSWDTSYHYDTGTYAGSNGLGSELDWVDFGTGTYDAFGLGYYEADVPDGTEDTAYAYYAVNSASGDYYFGWVYDDGTYGYYVGYTEQLYAVDDDGIGAWTYTIYDSYAYGYDAGVEAGTILTSWYYDGETGSWDTSYHYDTGTYAGSNGLGSELDWVDFGTGTYDAFGLGYYEADVL